jgi:hypothetical protein
LSEPIKPEINQEKEENSLLANSISSQEKKDGKNAKTQDGKIFLELAFAIFFRMEFWLRICRHVCNLENQVNYG